MATKSIYKNVKVKNKTFCRNLISAMENAENKASKKVVLSKKLQEVSGEKIKEIFGQN